MFNPFVMRKYAAMLAGPLLTTVFFYVGVVFYNLWVGLGLMFVGLLLAVLIGNLLIDNPFRRMLEGKGLLAFSLDSPGVIRPFNVGLDDPYIRGKAGRQKVQDIFDRDAVFQLSPPQEAKTTSSTNEKGETVISFTPDELNKNRFAFFHYPVLIWNNQIKQFITKEFFANSEKDAFAEHGVLYLNKQVEDLNSHLLNFGRYIVEQLKPASSIFANKWVIIAIVVVLVILGIMFAPVIIDAVRGVTSPAASAITKATSTGGVITPQ